MERRLLPLAAFTQTWWRLHPCHRDAVSFGCTGRNRFDAPGCPKGQYRALYAAADVHGAFIETLGRETGALADPNHLALLVEILDTYRFRLLP